MYWCIPRRTIGFCFGLGARDADIFQGAIIETAQRGALAVKRCGPGGKGKEASQTTAAGGKGQFKDRHVECSYVRICDV